MPPSSSTSTCPFTAATISGRARRVAEALSSWRPPWFETTTAVAPASIARRASSPVRTPLATSGPGQASRIQRKSFQVTFARVSAPMTSIMGIGPLPGITTFSSRGTPPSKKNERTQPGRVKNCGRKGSFSSGEPARSCFMPPRRSRSRRPAVGVSIVTKSAENPAARAGERVFRRFASADEIELIAHRPGGGGLNIFQFVAGNGGLGESDARGSRRARGGNFASGVHQADVTDRRENHRKRQIHPENTRARIIGRDGDGLTRTQDHVVVHALVLTKRDFVFGAAIEVIEDNFRQAALGEAAQVRDIDDPRGTERAAAGAHRFGSRFCGERGTRHSQMRYADESTCLSAEAARRSGVTRALSNSAEAPPKEVRPSGGTASRTRVRATRPPCRLFFPEGRCG